MNWVATEFKSMNLGDPRRKQRAIHLIESLSAKPTASIPQACGDWADTIGAIPLYISHENLYKSTTYRC
ncbi:transposase [Verminephrobacter aporrectodeae subsp. tuberculatae]|nr:transposase [Verminephrobacter aporrectodeae]MCW5258384.1 transposase [Verminephrobacter aporrectodeae subsp. tuberculatae]